MGWKLSTIFIKSSKPQATGDVLKKIGISGAQFQNHSTYNDVLNPELGTISVGQRGELLAISSWEAAEACLSPGISKLEENILRHFPKSEIGVALLQSTMDFWGLSLIADGKKKRVFCGSTDDGIIIDSGQELSFEQQFNTLTSDDDEFPEDFDAEGLVLHFTERFCDKPIGSDEFDFPVETWRVPRNALFTSTLPKYELRPALKPRQPSILGAWKKEMFRSVPREELIYRIKGLLVLVAITALILGVHFFRGR